MILFSLMTSELRLLLPDECQKQTQVGRDVLHTEYIAWLGGSFPVDSNIYVVLFCASNYINVF